MSIFAWWFRPAGYTLVRKDGSIANRIRGDLIPKGALSVQQDGKPERFNRTGEVDDVGFRIFREDHGLFKYRSPNS